VGPAICCGNNSAADLALGMTSSTNVSRVGSNVTYTINVTNRGPDAASDVVLTDNLPSSLVFLSANTPVGTWSINGGVVTFNLGTMTNSARATITITGIGTAQGIMTNTATISARTGDPNPGNSAATNALPVLPPAPVALFSATPVIGAWPLSVNFTDSSSGAITNRAWDFGNGATTNTAQTSFAVTYTTAGTNTVSLTVIGPGGTNVSTRPNYVAVTNPPPLLIVSPTNLGFGLLAVGQSSTQSFQIFNAGGLTMFGNVTTVPPYQVVSGSPFAVGGLQTNQVAISYTPTDAGTFSNAVIFTSNGGNSTNALSGDGAFVPMADFSGTPTSGFWPLTVSFTNGSTGTITNVVWDFGDGFTTNTSVSSLVHTYTGPGTNTVSLTTTGPVGVSTLTRQSYVTVTNLPPKLVLNPTNLDFGLLIVGQSRTQVFQIFNPGQLVLTGSVMVASPFGVAGGSPFSLNGGQTGQVMVSFNPGGAGSFSNAVSFTSNGGNSNNPVTGRAAFVPAATFSANPTSGFWPLTVTYTDNSSGTITNRFWDFGDGTSTNTTDTSLTHSYAGPSTNTVSLTASGPVGISTVVSNAYIVVTNLPPKMTVGPSSLDFGQVVVGQSRTQFFSVFNLGQLPLNGSVTTASPFSVVSGSPFSVNGRQTRLVQMVFSPTQAGSVNGAALFSSNDGGSTNGLSGIGLAPAQLAVLPQGLDFGIVAVGASAQASFVATNLGDVTISNAVVSVDSAFSVVVGNAFDLAGHSSTNVVIQFSPGAEGIFSNNVVFLTANAGSSTNPVTGATAPSPLASFSANPLSGFWPLTVSFTDNSSGAITNRFWDFGDGFTTNTSATNFTHDYAGPGTNAVTLTAYGPVGTSTVTSNAYIAVTNLPPKLVAGPSSLDFGSVIVGQSRTQFFSVFNPGQLVLQGSVTAPSPFSIVSGSPFSVNSRQATLMQVVFSPAQATGFNAAAIFTSNGGSSTNALSGIGLAAAQLTASPASIDFGILVVGTSAQASFVVTNLGDVTVSNIMASVDSAFSIVSGNSFNLPGHSSTNVVIQFAPGTDGVFSNNVVILSANDGSLTNSVTGTGASIPQANFQATPTNGFWPLMVSFADTSAGTITNRLWDFGDGATTNSSATTATHIYAGPSTNTVSLTASGPVGIDMLTIPACIVVTNLPARMVVIPTNVDFGPVIVGQSSTQLLQIVNIGQSVLTGAVAMVSPPFTVISDSAFTIAGGQTNVVMVRFRPRAEGSFGDKLIFTSNDGSSTNTVSGSGGLVPIASFTGSPSSGHWPLTVSFTSTSTGTITNLFWDFGDGATTNSGTANPSHTYALPGTNTVMLIASGTVGTDTMTLTDYLVVSNFPPQLAVSPSNLDFGIQLVGTSAQATFAVTNLGDLTASNVVVTAGGAPFSVVSGNSFNLAANSSTNVVIQFSPNTEGIFSNNVLFSPANAGTLTNTVSGNGLIVVTANFVGSPTSGSAPLTVNFVDSSTGTVTNRFWEFGDNTSTNVPGTNVAHTYMVGGSYTVRLTARGPAGSNTLTRAGYISANNVAPTADFTGSPLSGSAPLAVAFTDNSTGTVTNRLWDFGDGSTSNTTAIRVVHPYASGTYRVKLTATGPLGSNTRQKNNYISVTNAPAKLLVTPASQNFGGVIIGQTNTLPFQAINLGSFSLTGAVSVPSGSGFRVASGSPFTLAGGQTSAVMVAFSPSTTNTYNTNLVFTSNAGNTTNSVSGTGSFAAVIITSIQVSGPDVAISFSSSAGVSYSVEYTDTLMPASWSSAISAIAGTGSIVTATNSGGASGSSRFYRVRQLP
jgi:uncharacterized repeat protein (TIGR01451 family)